ncbi:MAG: universal stress protein [Methanosarcina sp.]|jgi:nucleotide-binding universal stress UspA family protein|nr:universal stress protein [Methanosarcina sp.]MDD3317536.1 universal stress protein [Methanosarcina sp.]MDD4305327.1 universal stress protein [Methanosarcina sp.]MDD4619222.1 universal stress protein [Methanosarcina sp.]NLN43495.1 universal stress protein [Methanosarcina sp.]
MISELYRNIVIATDGSENSQRAISQGIEIAKLSGATVHALYVVDSTSFSSIPMDAGWEAMYEILRGEGEKAIFEVKERGEASGVEVREVLLEGHPSNEIINFAEKNNADLIVVGTLGKTGLDRFLMGSVAEKIVRGSKVPVLVVRSEK